MKYVKFFYIIIIIITILMYLTGGFNPDKLLIELSSYDDYEEFGMIDGFSGGRYLSILNIAIMIVLELFLTVITINKSNSLNDKWPIFVITSLLIFFMPIGLTTKLGGIAGIKQINHVNVIYLFLK